MGCDIHGYIESWHDEYENWHLDADLHISRDYAMFGILAGVRSDEEPLFEPRGWDENSSTRWEYCLWVSKDETDDDQSCTEEKANEWVRRGLSKRVGDMVTHPDWHTPSWLTASEMAEVVKTYKKEYPERDSSDWEAIVAYLQALPNSRFTFWFDN